VNSKEIFWSSIRINFDILLILEPKECCWIVHLVGAHNNRFNNIYTKKNKLVNDMPYYVDRRLSAIWFDGIGWNIGTILDVKDGTVGHLYTKEFVDCPADTNAWLEWIDGEWNKSFAKPSCVKDTNKN